MESHLLAGSRSAQIEFRATLDERTEIDTLTARKSSAEFFAPPVQACLERLTLD